VKRVAFVLVGVLVVTSCHSIDRGVFAQGPVPLDELPLREPITYTAGPKAGQVVPTQHGLLASYFSGAAYVQPAYGEVLDHQQIDPNVDFQWDATGGVNPVIAVGGIDHADGHPFRPPQWPIWSIVWEGYLEAPATGEYVLNLHVNNGGWLEMKDPAGGLRTVISCPGGSGFEGDCRAAVDLTAGRHYIRISYYNNAPSSANAIFSWRKPGDAELSVVRTESLCTQNVACGRPNRAFMFVHGIHGSFADEKSFSLLLRPLADRYGDDRVERFRYFQDAGYRTEVGCSEDSRPPRIPERSAGLPLNTSAISLSRNFCDSESNVGLNAVLLDTDVKRLHERSSNAKVTVICNSMGCAITRAFLAYSMAAGTGVAATMVDNVISLQGAQQGGWIALPPYELQSRTNRGAAIDRLNALLVAAAIRKSVGFNAVRPAIADLRPRSETYGFVNPVEEHLPTNISYFNAASEINWHLEIGYMGLKWRRQIQNPADPSGSFGDYVILPGQSDPRALPEFGGGRFDPAVIGRGRDSVEWILRNDVTVPIDTYPVLLATLAIPGATMPSPPNEPLGLPETHFAFGARMREITYLKDRRTGMAAPLDQLILDEIYRQDP
jgi:hypothetical protein